MSLGGPTMNGGREKRRGDGGECQGEKVTLPFQAQKQVVVGVFTAAWICLRFFFNIVHGFCFVFQ